MTNLSDFIDIEPIADSYIKNLIENCKLADEISKKFGEVPKEETTEETIDEFIGKIIIRVLDKLSKHKIDSETYDILRPHIPDQIRINFLMGIRAARMADEQK